MNKCELKKASDEAKMRVVLLQSIWKHANLPVEHEIDTQSILNDLRNLIIRDGIEFP